jgi:hypothetical protein
MAAKTIKPKAFWIPGDLMIIDTLVLLGPADWASKECARRIGHDAIKAKCQGSVVAIESKTNQALMFHVLWVDGEPGGSKWADSVAHEVSHLVDRLLEAHSIPPGRESTEIRALLQGWYTKAICHGAWGTRNKTPKQAWE